MEWNKEEKRTEKADNDVVVVTNAAKDRGEEEREGKREGKRWMMTRR